ncbi:reverse transcriptase domain-containing protein [Tanacetum coccineum]
MDCPVVVDTLIEGFRVRRIHVDGGSSSEVMYKHYFRNLSYQTRSRLKESQIPLVRTEMRSLGAVASTIHSMIKFLTSNEIATIATTRETLRECRKIKEAQALSRHAYVTDPSSMQTSSKVTNPRVSLAPVETRSRRPRKEPMQLDDMEKRRQLGKRKKLPKSSVKEKIVTPTDMTGILRAITEHSLDTYPHIEPKVQKKRSLAPDRRKVVTDEVNEWLKAGVNLEAYVDDMVIKSRTEQVIIKDIKQTFSTLRRINMKLNQKKCSFGMEEGKFLGYIVTSEGIRANLEKIKAAMDMPSPRTLKQMQSLSGKLAAFNHFLSKSAERSLTFLDTLKKCTNKKDFRWIEAVKVAFLEMKKLVSELPTLTTPKKGETLMMYLAAANEAISAVLLTERDRRQMPIHYVSQSLQGGEINYALMEKLALALVHTVRWLRRYFQGSYGITYVPRVEVKGQVLANFLADTPTEINVTPEVASNLKVEDILESSNARENITPGPRAWRLYTDGASNNEGSRANLILIAPNDVEYSYALCLNFSNSNNDVEYKALLARLRIAMEMQVKDIYAFVDSKLVASQVEGSYEAKGERMIKYQEKVLELAGAFNRFRITHIPRANNRKANALSKLAAV